MNSEPRPSGSSTNVILIVCAVLGVGVIGIGILVVVSLAAITTIGQNSSQTFSRVGSAITSGGPGLDPGIQQVLDDQSKAWNRGDLSGFMTGYWNSPDLTYYSGGEPKSGYQALFAHYKKSYHDGGKKMGKLDFDNISGNMLGSDGAFVRGRWQVVDEGAAKSGLFTLVMRKMPDGWKIVHDHTSKAEPPKE